MRPSLGSLTLLFLLLSCLLIAPANARDEDERGAIGAHLHSRWFLQNSTMTPHQLSKLVGHAGLEVVPFGVPLISPEDRLRAPLTVHERLAATFPRPAIPQLNTFAMPADQQDDRGIRALFRDVAPVAAAHPNTLLVVGGNEPLTKGKAWKTIPEAEARVRLEYQAWHDLSDLPFCHKFTNPKVNSHRLGWDVMEALWVDSQDAICYDWYKGSGDTLQTLDYLAGLGQQLGKPVHILETAVPGNDPELMVAMASRVDTLTVYQLLAYKDGEDWDKAGWILLPDRTLQERGPGAMLRSVLEPYDVDPLRDASLRQREGNQSLPNPGTGSPDIPPVQVPGGTTPDVPGVNARVGAMRARVGDVVIEVGPQQMSQPSPG